jgi:tetratricopeptide (TPR) repeat protein
VRSAPAGLVDIVREFLLAHRLLRRLFERQRSGELRFDEVQTLAGDSEASVLFRLKERCHALFRAGDVGDDLPRVVLFDLAVGSLFHEAMKLRENFYQLEVYAPKVEAARRDAESGSEGLFEEFARILAASRERLGGLHQARRCWSRRGVSSACYCAHRITVWSCVIAGKRALADEVLGESLDAFLNEVHGNPVAAYALAARSYLESGYFEEARGVLAEALARDPARADLRRASAYADGLGAYLRGRYDDALRHLERWAEAAPAAEDAAFRELALSAVTRLATLSEGAGQTGLGERAAALAQRLAPQE